MQDKEHPAEYAWLKAESDRLERERNLTDDTRPAGTVTKHQARHILDDKKASDETSHESKADRTLTASQRQAAAMGFGEVE